MFIVFLTMDASSEAIHELTVRYLQKTQKGQPYLLSDRADQVGYFLACELMRDEKDSSPWKLQIPLGCVLAIADMRGDNHPLGFLT